MQALHPPSFLEPVGEYEIIAKLAKGGMATVYLCRRAKEGGFRRLYALKVMHEHLADNEEFVNMLLDEARLASRLHHPNVASIVDMGHHERGYFLVLEYVEGCSLAQLFKRTKETRPPGLIANIMIDTLYGLNAAHVLSDDDGVPLHLVHRDVSPQNILVGVDGSTRITDFGIAKAEARVTSTRPGVRKGKFAFMAPEQLNQESEVDRRSDIFAAGAVLWTALTGEHLFRGDTEAATIRNLMHMEVPKPSEVGLKPPACFDDVCLKALQRDPEERYQTASEMASALRHIALRNNLLAAPTEVAEWVTTTFATELERLRNAIQEAATRSKELYAMIESGQLSMPAHTGSFPSIPTLTTTHSGFGSNPSSVSAIGDVKLVDSQDPSQLTGAGGKRRLGLWIGLAAILAAVLFVILRPAEEPASEPETTAAAVAPVPEPEPVVEPEPEPVVVEEKQAEAAAATAEAATDESADEEAKASASEEGEADEEDRAEAEERAARWLRAARQRAARARQAEATPEPEPQPDPAARTQPAQLPPASEESSVGIEGNPYLRRR